MAVNIGYDFSAVLGKISKTPSVTRYLIESGKDLKAIPETDLIEYGIRYALENPKVSRKTLVSLLNIPSSRTDFLDRMVPRVDIVHDFLSSVDSSEIARVSGAIARAMREPSDRVAAAAAAGDPDFIRLSERIFDILLMIDLSKIGDEFAPYGEAIGALCTDEKRANLAAAKMREGELSASITDGYYHRGLYFFCGSNAAYYITDRNFTDWLMEYALGGDSNWGNSGLNYSRVFALSPIDDGDYAIECFRKIFAESRGYAGWSKPVRFFILSYNNIDFEFGKPDIYRKVLETIIDECASVDEEERRRALLALSRIDSAAIRDYKDLWVDFLCFPLSETGKRNSGMAYDVTCEIFAEASIALDLEMYRDLYDLSDRVGDSKFSAYSKTKFRYDLIQSIVDRVPVEAASGALSPSLASTLWDITVEERGKDKPASTVSAAQQALVSSGCMTMEKLAEASQQRGKVGVMAKQAMTGFKAAEKKKTKTGAMLDFAPSPASSFKDYVAYGVGQGLEPIAVLGLFAVDSRFDNPSRALARKDFIDLLNATPEIAESIPEEVWAGLLRVRDALPIGMALAMKMQELGEQAAKLGSKHLVKSVLL